MKLPLQVTFRDVDSSPAVERIVEKKVEKLDSIYDGLVSCRVVIESPHNKQSKGNLFSCHIDLTVSGDQIVVGKDPQDNRAHEDVYTAVNDAFRAAERQLKAVVERRRENKRSSPAL